MSESSAPFPAAQAQPAASFPAAPPTMELVLWRPDGHDFELIFPLSQGERPENAVAAYLARVGKVPDLARFAKLLARKKGSFRAWPRNSADPISAALVTRGEFFVNDLAPRSRHMHQMLDPLAKRGAKTFLIPAGLSLTLGEEERRAFFALINREVDLLVAPGGSDVDPALYGVAVRHARGVNPMLDRDQFPLVRSYLKSSTGFFYGVCRGAQMGAVAHGCDLIQDIEKEVPGSDRHHSLLHLIPASHEISGEGQEAGSVSDRILRGETLNTRQSRHHQGIKVVPGETKNMKITAVDPHDGLVELVEFTDSHGRTKGLGAQFHSETDRQELRDRVYQAIYDEAAEARSRRLERQAVSPLPSIRTCSGEFAGIKGGSMGPPGPAKRPGRQK